MSAQELCILSLAEQARLIRIGELSPVELLAATLAQIDRVEERINAFITVLREEAEASAREAEREISEGGYRSPIHGIPIALKDLFCTKGVRTTAGSKILRDFVPADDATVVSLLREAGAVIIGKTGMHEFAYGPVGTNPHYGDVHNPWDLDRVTGGSSSGSAAAVSAGMCSAALGSDTGGSIRIPAALCGVVGLKPTYSRVSRSGVLPCAWSLDHVGPLTRTAEDAALVMGVVAGWDPKDTSSSRGPVPDYAGELSRGVSRLKLAVLSEYATDPMDPEVRNGFEGAVALLSELGGSVDEVSVPLAHYAVGASSAILSGEITAYHEGYLRTRPEEYGPDVRERLETGLLVSATDYVKAQRVRRLMVERFRALLETYDALLCPTEPAAAPRLDQDTIKFEGLTEGRSAALVRHTRLFNLTGLPAASVPCGFTSDGLPFGLQIAAAPFAEGTVLRIAHAYQQVTDWHPRRQPIVRANGTK